MKNKYVLMVMFAVLFFSVVLVSNVQATVGGPTFIYDFRYNPQDESVYYIKVSGSGRGCPPELIKMSLASGQTQVVFSCNDGENLIRNANYENASGLVNSEIYKITKDFKLLTPINLKENNIFVDVNFLNSVNYSSEINEVMKSNFNASVYQDSKKVVDLPISGCNTKQPFIFAGYAIPGFDKKIVLLLSTKGDCFEGGYIYETLHVVGGVDNLDKSPFSNDYKYAAALTPSEGTLVVFEEDKLNTGTTETPAQNTSDNSSNPRNMYFYLIGVIAVIVSVIIGIIIGRLSVKRLG